VAPHRRDLFFPTNGWNGTYVDSDRTLIEELRARLATALEESSQLRTALESRVVIEQAKGMLAERFGITVEESFAVLRRSSRNTGMRLHELAAQIVYDPATPLAIAEQLRRIGRPRLPKNT
jgi:ANTAR domain